MRRVGALARVAAGLHPCDGLRCVVASGILDRSQRQARTQTNTETGNGNGEHDSKDLRRLSRASTTRRPSESPPVACAPERVARLSPRPGYRRRAAYARGVEHTTLRAQLATRASANHARASSAGATVGTAFLPMGREAMGRTHTKTKAKREAEIVEAAKTQAKTEAKAVAATAAKTAAQTEAKAEGTTRRRAHNQRQRRSPQVFALPDDQALTESVHGEK